MMFSSPQSKSNQKKPILPVYQDDGAGEEQAPLIQKFWDEEAEGFKAAPSASSRGKKVVAGVHGHEGCKTLSDDSDSYCATHWILLYVAIFGLIPISIFVLSFPFPYGCMSTPLVLGLIVIGILLVVSLITSGFPQHSTSSSGRIFIVIWAVAFGVVLCWGGVLPCIISVIRGPRFKNTDIRGHLLIVP